VDASGLDVPHAGLSSSRFAVATREGPARVELAAPPDPPAALVVLGHGAGGGIEAPDLLALAAALPAAGYAVARVEQPYRVAGRRTPAPAGRLDDAWRTVVADLTARPGATGCPVVVGGRSSGARVACRTAAATGAAAVVALAFPLRPPGRSASRLDELLAVTVPTLVVQGSRDPFGSREEFPPGLPTGMEIVEVAGADHGFRARRADARTSAQCLADVAAGVAGWLSRQLLTTSRLRTR